MTTDNFNACLDKTLSYEGGYTDDPNDAGNWTGCAVGVGECKGTYKGISSCAYPNVDIKNLSDEDIATIYHDDYWMKCGGDDCPPGVDLCSFDGSVNSGPGNGVQWLQMAMGMPASEIDGAYGPNTASYVAKITDPGAVIDDMCDARLEFLRSLSTWDRYGAGWTNRVEDVRSTAHAMTALQPPLPPQPVTQVITITIQVPAGVSVSIVTNGG
jgi:lysozyme family protein